ncbi:MAG: RlpA-like double-psi beta-barrel domain-containing protein [bacterium]|nr:RlpA-like double-psi beta-barrel domain-containing protein [bacterium]
MQIKILSRKFNAILLILSVLSISAGFVYADDDIVNNSAQSVNKEYHINLDKPTIAKGYTVSAFDNSLKLSLVPGILSDDTGVDVLELNEEMEMPWRLDHASEIYQYEFLNKAAYDNHKPFYIQFSYNEQSNDYKQVFFYDKNYAAWRPLPTKDYPKEMFVRSLIHLPFARIAVFSYPDVLTSGKASWYKYKGGNFAASPDFPKGSRLRVYNNENGKFVDVEINDYGPERSLHPDRAIDLDKAAFARLAPISQGTISVYIEPLYIAPESGRVLGIAASGATAEPVITVKSVMLIDERTGNTILEKNSTSTLPIASLTKLIAIKAFLDTRPSLDRVVAYSVKDEEYNYQYCNKWESAKLNINDGETLTIEDLLYASLVGSANNTIETLVRVSGLSREDFVGKMNELVKSWGAVATRFVEPTGLSPENVSSAADYAIITKEVFTHPIIQKASVMDEYKFYTINGKKFHRIKNTNRLIKKNSFNITGSKTGYLDEAGYCLMTRIKSKDGNNIIAVTLGADSRDKSFGETEELLEYGIKKMQK